MVRADIHVSINGRDEVNMKVCITASGSEWNSQIDARFGRCQVFDIVDLETGEIESVPNPNIETSGGAGIQSAQLVASRGVKAVITGHVGPNAFGVLNAAGVEIFIGSAGTVKDAAEAYRSGKLQRAQAEDARSKLVSGQ